MSGHSKWANIRIRKGKQDAQRGKLFTKLSREIIAAAREGGGNPDANLRLKTGIQKARDNSMPMDRIHNAIDRATGNVEDINYEESTFEGYGPGGVAVMARCLSDNRNRTVAEIRNTFNNHGGNLGETGCVAFVFENKGFISIPQGSRSEDDVFMAAIEAGAEDVFVEADSYDVVTAPQDFTAVRAALEADGFEFLSAELTMMPNNTIKLEGKEAEQMLVLMEALEDLDDVQQVYANFDIPDEVLAAAS